MNNDLWMKRIRNTIGLLGMILPWICLLGYYLVYRSGSMGLEESFPNHMSITYYVTPVFSMVIAAASIVLITYVGYDWRDRLITTLSGVFGLLIVLFPSGDTNHVLESVTDTGVTGYFQTPVAINSFIHNTSAIIFFLLLAFNSFVLFTKGEKEMTAQKKRRNVVYKICAIGMVLALSLYVIPVPLPHKTFWGEAVALSFFGISWLTKGGVWLKDKKVELEEVVNEIL